MAELGYAASKSKPSASEVAELDSRLSHCENYMTIWVHELYKYTCAGMQVCKSTCRYRTCLRMPFPPVQHRPSAEDYPFLAGSSDLKLASTWFPEVTTADCHRPLRGRSKTVPTLETCWKSPVSMSKAHHASSSALRLVKALGYRCTMLCCTIASFCKRTYSNDPSCIRIESSISEQVLSCPVSSSF